MALATSGIVSATAGTAFSMDFTVVTKVNVGDKSHNCSVPATDEADSDTCASSVASSDWLQLEMLLNVSPRQGAQQASTSAAPSGPNNLTTLMTKTKTTKSQVITTKTTTSASVTAAAEAAADSIQGQSSSQQLDISEYVRLLQRLRRRRRLLGMGRGGRQQLQRLETAQRRLRQLLATREDEAEGEAWETGENDDNRSSSSVTLLDCSLWNSSSVAAAAKSQREAAVLDATIKDSIQGQQKLNQPVKEQQETQEQQQQQRQISKQEQQARAAQQDETQQELKGQLEEPSLADIGPSDEPLSGGSNLESGLRSPGLVLQMPEPLLASAKASQRARVQQQQQLQQAILPQPQLQPPGPKSTLALKPLMACRLPEPVLSLAFDPVGRRLICAEPSRGICFRSVTCSGDDLAASERLDWRLWAHTTCVLPSGHLLVATSYNLQVIRPDGVRLSASERRFLIIAMTVHDRSVLTLSFKQQGSSADPKQKRSYVMSVYELPRLTPRQRHPLHGTLPASLKSPVAMCTLRSLAAVAQLDDTLQTIEIDSGRLRQSVHVSSRRGPQQLVSCNILGLLFVSVFADRCIHMFQLRGSMLEKVGSYRDPSVLPGPLAWLPINGILFCACCLANDTRRNELRTLGLHEADRTNWTPKAIRLMPL